MRPHMMPNQSPCLSVKQTNDISQEVRTGTLRNTHRVKKILGIVIIVSFRRSWKPHRPTDTQDESKEVRRRDAHDVVGAKVNAGTDLLPSTASSHTYNRIKRERTQFCGLFGMHEFGGNSMTVEFLKGVRKVAQTLHLKERTGSHRRSWRLQ